LKDGEAMADIFNLVGSLEGKNVMPLCAKHEPKASLQKESGGYIVFVHCDECRFTAWIHPDTYMDMMVEDMLDEVGDRILKEDQR
jgi:hypothetical protein